MRKLPALAVALAVTALSSPMSYAGAAAGPVGPAPNSGDGVSDGSGLKPRTGPNAPQTSPASEPTPAPCLGDADPDGVGQGDDCDI
jgi:hypothetical protein